MAGWTGLEPAAFRVTGGRYNQLNYHPADEIREDLEIYRKKDLISSAYCFAICIFLAQFQRILVVPSPNAEVMLNLQKKGVQIMKNLLKSLTYGIALTGLMTTFSFAETTTLQVSGMHCGGCQSAIESAVCKNGNYVKCEAKIDNPKKQMGSITLETKDGEKLDLAKIQSEIKDAGYEAILTPNKKDKSKEKHSH